MSVAAEMALLPMREQYARFCVELDIFDNPKMYNRGLQDYEKLCRIPGVIRVGIDWKERRLIVGTECIDVVYQTEPLIVKELGHFIMIMYPDTKIVKIENLTRTIQGYHHPHISTAGTMCIGDGRLEAQHALAECRFSVTTEIYMIGLRMDSKTTKIGYPYKCAELSNWPNKKYEVVK